MRVHQAFHRHMGKQWLPAAQNQGLPQSPHTPIAIGKGVDKFKLVMKDATGNQGRLIGCFHSSRA